MPIQPVWEDFSGLMVTPESDGNRFVYCFGHREQNHNKPENKGGQLGVTVSNNMKINRKLDLHHTNERCVI